MECGTNRANIHCLPKNIAAGNVFSVDLDLPLPGRIVVKHSTQECAMARHLLFLGKFFSLAVLFLFFLCSPDVIRKQAAAGAFKKISIAPRASR
jgi:hypothetical protein